MALDLIDGAVESGARLKQAAAALGLSARTLMRWQGQHGGNDRRCGPNATPANKLTGQERQQILDVANSAAYRDMSPKQIVPKLADQGRSTSPRSQASIGF